MDERLKTALWQQYGAAIDTLADMIDLCPEPLWTAFVYKDEEDERFGQFWFVAYHAVFWLDMFVTGSDNASFLPPAPFVRGRLPDAPYAKADVRGYLDQCRQKAQSIIEALTDETAFRICKYEWMEPTFLELQMYTMRHLMEHAAELGLRLGEHDVTGMDWIAKARETAS
jgi:hypothetical protein